MKTLLILVRSILFNLAFYINTIIFVILLSPLLFTPRRWAMAALRWHARASVFLQKLIVGNTLEIRGLEKLPPGAVLVAAKHQSAWDTFALVTLFDDPAMIMKAELKLIPLYGWFAAKFEMIFVERSKGPSALRKMIKDAKDRARQGRQIFIFPEGTRRAPGAEPDYKSGILLLYDGLDIPCVPVALNSGLFWPRRLFMRYPGKIIVEILDPIEPGLPRAEFKARLISSIEDATAALIAESGELGDVADVFLDADTGAGGK